MADTNKHSPHQPTLDGARVLIVEDDYLLALDLAHTLAEAGAFIIGPSTTVASAMELAGDEAFAAGVLDIRLHGKSAEPIAELLKARKIPFLFYTGQPLSDPLLAKWPAAPVMSKPALPHLVVAAVARLLKSRKLSASRTKNGRGRAK